jgi:putative PIN family toxin of toxin-antitoxin system
MIRAVLDANILVSMFPASKGSLAEIVARWERKQFQIITSEHILQELKRTWLKPYWLARFPETKALIATRRVHRYAEIVEVALPVAKMATHPEDDYILATALNSDADLLVTGDKQLLQLEHIGRTVIVSPAAFLAHLDNEFPGQR